MGAILSRHNTLLQGIRRVFTVPVENWYSGGKNNSRLCLPRLLLTRYSASAPKITHFFQPFLSWKGLLIYRTAAPLEEPSSMFFPTKPPSTVWSFENKNGLIIK